jgi:hypothetical protein
MSGKIGTGGRLELRPWGYESALGVLQFVTPSHTTLTFITTCPRYRALSVCTDRHDLTAIFIESRDYVV